MSKRLVVIPQIIISGGQTGADQGGLLAARDLGVETGGVAPKGWMTENGAQESLLRSFGLTECGVDGYSARTRENVANSDATLIVGQSKTGGTALTVETGNELQKPMFFVPRDSALSQEASAQFRFWLKEHNVRTLNVAGNRESQSPGICEFTRNFLVTALR